MIRWKVIWWMFFLFFPFLFTACSLPLQKAEKVKQGGVEELEEVKEIKVGGTSDEVKGFKVTGLMKISWGLGSEEGKVYSQKLREEAGLYSSQIGVERFIPDGKGSVYLVDHPPDVLKVRVQKFAFPYGKLVRSKYLPASTLFKSDSEGRFFYYHPRGVVGELGIVTIEKEEGAVETTLAVPSEILPGDIFLVRGDVYLLDEEYATPPVLTQERTVHYFPLLIGLKEGRKIEANYVGWDGNFYFFGARAVDALNKKPIGGSRFLFGPIKEDKPEKKFVFPWEVSLAGVDKKGFIYVVRERSLGFSLDSDNRNEWSISPRFLYRISPQGKITHYLRLPAWFEPSMFKKFFVWVDKEGNVWLLIEEKEGVEIRKYAPLQSND